MGERGTSAMEFAFVLPFMVVLIYFLMEGTILLQTWARVEHASREAARYGATFPRPPTGDVEARGYERLVGLSGTSTVTATQETSGGDPRIQVTVTHTYQMKLLTGIASTVLKTSFPGIPMTAQTRMRLE
jgi:Flp pilus assembly protein TadG